MPPGPDTSRAGARVVVHQADIRRRRSLGLDALDDRVRRDDAHDLLHVDVRVVHRDA